MHQNKNQNKYKQHVPVLLNAVLRLLDPQAGESYLDLTAGYGGHASAILDLVGSLTSAVLVDRDQNAVNVLKEMYTGGTVEIRQQDFLTVSRELLAEGRKFD